MADDDKDPDIAASAAPSVNFFDDDYMMDFTPSPSVATYQTQQTQLTDGRSWGNDSLLDFDMVSSTPDVGPEKSASGSTWDTEVLSRGVSDGEVLSMNFEEISSDYMTIVNSNAVEASDAPIEQDDSVVEVAQSMIENEDRNTSDVFSAIVVQSPKPVRTEHAHDEDDVPFGETSVPSLVPNVSQMSLESVVSERESRISPETIPSPTLQEHKELCDSINVGQDQDVRPSEDQVSIEGPPSDIPPVSDTHIEESPAHPVEPSATSLHEEIMNNELLMEELEASLASSISRQHSLSIQPEPAFDPIPYAQEEDINNAAKMALVAWMIDKADIIPTRASHYATLIIAQGIGSIKRLGKKVAQDGCYLANLGVDPDDAEEMVEALHKGGIISVPLPVPTPVKGGADVSPATPTPATPTLTQSASNASLQDTVDSASTSIVKSSSEPNISALDVTTKRKTKKKSAEETEKTNAVKAGVHNVIASIKEAFNNKDTNRLQDVLNNIPQLMEPAVKEYQRYFVKYNLSSSIVDIMKMHADEVELMEIALHVVAQTCRYQDSKSYNNLDMIKSYSANGVIEAAIALLQRYESNPAIVAKCCNVIKILCTFEPSKLTISNSSHMIMNIIVKYTSNTDIIVWGFRVIGHISNGVPGNRLKFISVGACEHILTMLQKYSDNSVIIGEGCWSLRNLIVDDNSRVVHAAEFLLSTLTKYCDNDSVAIEILRLLITLVSNNEPLIVKFGQLGIMKALIRVLIKNNDSSTLVRWSFMLICMLLTNDDMRSRFVAAKGCEALTEMLEKHNSNEVVAEWGCKVVHNLALLDGVASRMRNAGICETVVNAIQRQTGSVTVAEFGALALTILATDKNNRSRLATAGACESVILLLQRHEGSVVVASRICSAIHFLALDTNNRQWLGAAGACEGVTRALYKHITNDSTAIAAVRAIGSLACEYDGNCTRLRSCKACEGVVNAMSHHINNELMAEFASRAISHLCLLEDNCRRIGHAKGCELVVEALKIHCDSAAVARQGCLAVQALGQYHGSSGGSNNNARLTAAGVNEAVVCVITKHVSSDLVAVAGCIAISQLVVIDDNRKLLSAAGACEIVAMVLTTHASIEPVTLQAVMCIERLARNSDTNKNKLGLVGACEGLLAVLGKYILVESIVVEVYKCLVTLLTYDTNKTRMITGDNIVLLVRALRKNKHSLNAARWGCTLLQLLVSDNSARTLMQTTNIVEAVSFIINKHHANNELCYYTSMLIVSLCQDDFYLPKFHTAEIYDSMTMALQTHVDDVMVVEWGCKVIICLSRYQQRQRRGSKVVTASTSSAGSAKAPNTSLRNIFDSTTAAVADASKHRSTGFNSTDVVVKILKLHVGSEIVLRLAMEVLLYVLQEDSSIPSVVEQNAVLYSIFLSYLHTSEILESLIVRCYTRLCITEDGAAKCSNVCTTVLSYLQYYHINKECYHNALGLLTNLCNYNSNKIVLNSNNIAQLLLQYTKYYYDKDAADDKTLAIELRCFKALVANNKHSKGILTTLGFIDYLITTLVQPHNSLLQHSAIAEHLLWLVATVPPQDMNILCTSTFVKFIVTSIASYSNDSVTLNACLAIHTLCQVDNIKKLFMEYDMSTTISSLLTNSNSEVLYNTCLIIALLAENSPLQNTIPVSNIVKLLQKHENEVLLAGVLAAVNSMVLNCPSNQDAMNNSQLVKLLFKTVGQYSTATTVKRTCSLVAYLTSVNSEFQAKFSSVGLLNYIVESIKHYIELANNDTTSVLAEGCWAICNCSHNNPSNKAKFGKLNTIEVLHTILTRYSTHEATVLWASGAIANLSAGSAENAHRCNVVGIPAVLVDILRQYGLGGSEGSEAVLKYVCWAIGNLSIMPPLAQSLGEAGVNESIILILIKHSSNDIITQLVCTTIRNLSKDVANKRMLLAAGAIDAVENCKTIHGENENIMKWINKALAELTAVVDLTAPADPTPSMKESGRASNDDNKDDQKNEKGRPWTAISKSLGSVLKKK